MAHVQPAGPAAVPAHASHTTEKPARGVGNVAAQDNALAAGQHAHIRGHEQPVGPYGHDFKFGSWIKLHLFDLITMAASKS